MGGTFLVRWIPLGRALLRESPHAGETQRREKGGDPNQRNDPKLQVGTVLIHGLVQVREGRNRGPQPTPPRLNALACAWRFGFVKSSAGNLAILATDFLSPVWQGFPQACAVGFPTCLFVSYARRAARLRLATRHLSLSFGREIHAAEEGLEARVGAQGIETWIYV